MDSIQFKNDEAILFGKKILTKRKVAAHMNFLGTRQII